MRLARHAVPSGTAVQNPALLQVGGAVDAPVADRAAAVRIGEVAGVKKIWGEENSGEAGTASLLGFGGYHGFFMGKRTSSALTEGHEEGWPANRRGPRGGSGVPQLRPC